MPHLRFRRPGRSLRPPLVALLASALCGVGVGSASGAAPAATSSVSAAAPAPAAAIGVFTQATDIGTTARPGAVAYDPASASYRLTGGGANIWGREDAFRFLWRQLSGDLSLRVDIAWEGAGAQPHRKAAPMIRAGLAPDDPYVDIAVHGDGLIELQVRREKGGDTIGVRTPVKAPATVWLERDGDVFTASVAPAGQPFQTIGALALPLPDPVYVGLAVCAHQAQNLETARFSHVALQSRTAAPGARRERETSLEILTVATGARRLVWRDRTAFEAPNWSPDGRLLYINRGGRIYTLPASGGVAPTLLPTGAADKCNNDHGLSADGRWLALSSGGGKEGSRIFVVPATGGEPRLVTPRGPSYWHGWSPDGATLIYCAKRGDNFDLYAIPTAGGEERRLTTADGLDDGCEFTPDGTKIYFNSERTGAMRIWRMHPDGSQPEPVTFDEAYGDWFPHPSPDGRWLVFLSFDRSVKGHPANQNVVLRLLPLTGRAKPKIIATLFGGQGTINVPSWSPDSREVAFVSYRHVLPASP